ncbi:MAG TPA: subclass B3 metallo-beta-lactamase, partial [Cyclobacteriaceae bacterium]|nr:subclass B3 metallo-beta-lactamase [Cyclobacteriaceae bacterium]
AGNLYYVGTYDLACYLITTPAGNILINTGLANSLPQLRDNIEALGFKLADTKILLTTQAHYDHTGAIAAIKKITGAKLMVNEKDAPVMADGGKSDFAFGTDISNFEPVAVDRLLHDRDTIRLGNTVLTALHHPGHTKGATSFMMDAKDGNTTYKTLIVNMPSIVVSKPFPQVTQYPEIAKDYAYTFEALKKLQFDLWVSSHAAQFNLHSKRKEGDPYDPTKFKDRQGYDKAVADLEAAYKTKLTSK